MASKRRIRRKACTGKARHKNRAGAMVACKIARRRGLQMRAYHCQFCGGWHIGHQNGKRKALEMAFQLLENL